jgi:hypothetical protein
MNPAVLMDRRQLSVNGAIFSLPEFPPGIVNTARNSCLPEVPIHGIF